MTSFRTYASSGWFWIAVTILGCCIVMLPLPLLGIPEGFDTPEHLRFVETYERAAQSGVVMPGWAGSDNFGFGSVGIRFYPPLAHYTMLFVRALTGDWYDTIWITAFFWMIIGAIGIYLWARDHLPARHSAFAALLFATMPYHVMQLYSYMLLAEFAAIAILPYCFLLATRIIKRGKPIDILLFAAAFSAFILTHLPSIIVGSIALGIYCLFLIEWRGFWKTFIRFAIAFAISLSATAFYLARLLTEVSWVRHSDPQFYATSIYDYRQYLFPMVLNPEQPYWKKMVLLVDIPIFLTFLFLLPPLLCLLLRPVRKSIDKPQQKLLIALAATGLFLIFILSYPSAFIWDSVVLLQKLQFPFRFLSAASVVAAFATILSLSLLLKQYGKHKKIIGYGVLTVLFATALFTLTQIIIPGEADLRDKFREKIEKTQNEAGCRCWWPAWADARALRQRERVTAENRNVEVYNWDDETRTFIVEAGTSETARIATFWYPYWKASVNGEDVEINRDEAGAIVIPLPHEKASINLQFREPFFLVAAKYVSLFCWLALLTGLILAYLFEKQSFYGPSTAETYPEGLIEMKEGV